MEDATALERGALNLLQGCAGAQPGQSIVLIEEDAAAGYYGAGLGAAIAAAAEHAGIRVSRMVAPFRADVSTLDDDQARAVATHDHVLFLARLGDQLRFRSMPVGAKPIVSYVLDRASLASDFGGAPYGAFVALKQAIDAFLGCARTIRVTCPLGTDFSGRPPRAFIRPPVDVTIKRFPMSIFAPMPAEGFDGVVAVAHVLCGTGSRYYEPYGFRLERPVYATIANGRLISWRGPSPEVSQVERHYAEVAQRFGIDGGAVHSWHAGIHPACSYPGSAHADYARWSGSAFGNPRLLHFHTCGAYAPGEISWHVVDPTIEVDGVTVWDAGRIEPAAIPGAAAILAHYPDVARLFAEPRRIIGLGELGEAVRHG